MKISIIVSVLWKSCLSCTGAGGGGSSKDPFAIEVPGNDNNLFKKPTDSKDNNCVGCANTPLPPRPGPPGVSEWGSNVNNPPGSGPPGNDDDKLFTSSLDPDLPMITIIFEMGNPSEARNIIIPASRSADRYNCRNQKLTGIDWNTTATSMGVYGGIVQIFKGKSTDKQYSIIGCGAIKNFNGCVKYNQSKNEWFKFSKQFPPALVPTGNGDISVISLGRGIWVSQNRDNVGSKGWILNVDTKDWASINLHESVSDYCVLSSLKSILIIGGKNSDNVALNNVRQYIIHDNKWKELARMKDERSKMMCSLIPNVGKKDKKKKISTEERIYVVGGYHQNGPVDSKINLLIGMKNYNTVSWTYGPSFKMNNKGFDLSRNTFTGIFESNFDKYPLIYHEDKFYVLVEQSNNEKYWATLNPWSFPTFPRNSNEAKILTTVNVVSLGNSICKEVTSLHKPQKEIGNCLVYPCRTPEDKKIDATGKRVSISILLFMSKNNATDRYNLSDDQIYYVKVHMNRPKSVNAVKLSPGVYKFSGMTSVDNIIHPFSNIEIAIVNDEDGEKTLVPFTFMFSHFIYNGPPLQDTEYNHPLFVAVTENLKDYTGASKIILNGYDTMFELDLILYGYNDSINFCEAKASDQVEKQPEGNDHSCDKSLHFRVGEVPEGYRKPPVEENQDQTTVRPRAVRPLSNPIIAMFLKRLETHFIIVVDAMKQHMRPNGTADIDPSNSNSNPDIRYSQASITFYDKISPDRSTGHFQLYSAPQFLETDPHSRWVVACFSGSNLTKESVKVVNILVDKTAKIDFNTHCVN